LLKPNTQSLCKFFQKLQAIEHGLFFIQLARPLFRYRDLKVRGPYRSGAFDGERYTVMFRSFYVYDSDACHCGYSMGRKFDG
jgi:hypothetical protein